MIVCQREAYPSIDNFSAEELDKRKQSVPTILLCFQHQLLLFIRNNLHVPS